MKNLMLVLSPMFISLTLFAEPSRADNTTDFKKACLNIEASSGKILDSDSCKKALKQIISDEQVGPLRPSPAQIEIFINDNISSSPPDLRNQILKITNALFQEETPEALGASDQMGR